MINTMSFTQSTIMEEAYSSKHSPILTKEQLETFKKDGILVVDNVFTSAEIEASIKGLEDTLLSHGVDVHNLSDTGCNLRHLSSTNGSGGVLDIFYTKWKMELCTNPKFFRMTGDLWQAAFYHNGESKEYASSNGEFYKYHPYGKFNCDQGFMYIDRIGFRLPSALSSDLGEKLNYTNNNPSNTTCSISSKRKKKVQPIQRSLTPHLDCCPTTYNDPTKQSKWRPIQSFISLTDNLDPNTGGFEAAPGFHTFFNEWSKTRSPTIFTKKIRSQNNVKDSSNIITTTPEVEEIPAPCIGDYTHIRPKEDSDVMKRIKHIPVKAGSVVFWDNRIPHANSYHHNGTLPRIVVYASFLPNVPINNSFVQKQLEDWKYNKKPTDQWNNIIESANQVEKNEYAFSALGRKLIGLESW